jgi:hypothetical protein
MADTISFVPLDDDGERILDELETQAGLESDTVEDRVRVYTLEGDDQRGEVIEALADIDAEWQLHVSIEAG